MPKLTIAHAAAIIGLAIIIAAVATLLGLGLGYTNICYKYSSKTKAPTYAKYAGGKIVGGSKPPERAEPRKSRKKKIAKPPMTN